MLKNLLHSYGFKYAIAYAFLLSFCALLGIGVVYSKFNEIFEQELENKMLVEIKNQRNYLPIMPPVHDNSVIVIINKQSMSLLRKQKIGKFFIIGKSLLPYHSGSQLKKGMQAILIKKNGKTILIAIPFQSKEVIDSAINVIIYISIVFIILMLLYSYFINNQLSRKANYISITANEIMKGEMNKRIHIDPSKKDRFTKISITLNDMLSEIENLINDMEQVTSNIAHDLKSPINRIKSRMEVSRLNARSNKDYEDVIDDSITDLDEVLHIFNALLLIANTSSHSSNSKFNFKSFSLTELMDNIADLYEASAEEKQQKLSHSIDRNINIWGNDSLFAQAISNLVENAIKYTQNGGDISLSLVNQGEFISIRISDNGPGIPDNKKDEVFKRFSRLDESRNLPGTGLGLSLVKSILNVHQATIKLENNHPGLIICVRCRKLC